MQLQRVRSMSKVAVFVSTKDRPQALRRSLPQIAGAAKEVDAPVLVIDDASCGLITMENQKICLEADVLYTRLPSNRGLAAVLNIGLEYYLADTDIQWISYFQDDVDVDPLALKVLLDVCDRIYPFATGFDAPEHPCSHERKLAGCSVKIKNSTRATHMHAHRDYWRSVMPIPTRELGAPKRIAGQARGIGSNVDWWIVTNAPASVARTREGAVVVPGLVSTFYWKAEDSNWGADAPEPAAPIHRGSIEGWLKNHG